MIQSAKKIVKSLLRLLLTPLRACNLHSNGVCDHRQRKEIPNDILLTAVKEAIREGHTATIIVRGWSMRPFLEHERDKVLLEGAASYNIGDAVLAEIRPGHYVLHRITKINGEDVTLMGDGNTKGTETCKLTDICGVVKQYIRPRRTICADDPALKRRVRLWRKLLPIRRFLLLIYGVTV